MVKIGSGRAPTPPFRPENVIGYILAVDPGIRGAGVALFEGVSDHTSELISADYVENTYARGNGPLECAGLAREIHRWIGRRLRGGGLSVLAEIAVEWPKVYTQGKLKGDPGDLLPLAGVDAAIVAFSMGLNPAHLAPSAVYHYEPHVWKGNLPKGKLFESRLMERLTWGEKDKIERCGGLTHNVLDAVGIGLHHLGRFAPRKVIAR